MEYRNYLKDVGGLFPMPRIMAEVSRRIRSDDAAIDDLAELLLTDATLVSGIVRLSNSSYFGFAEKSESLVEAMQRIGLREIARLVGVCVASEVYQAELRHYRIPPEVFWESGIAAALLMERLASVAGLDTEAAYLAGLMRESGMLVIDYALEKEGRVEIWDSYLPLADWERDLVGHDHMEVGAELLRGWGFAEEVCAAVAGQWGDGARGEGLAGLLNLVVRLLARTGCEFGIRVSDFSEFEKAMKGLGLDEAVVLEAIEVSSAKLGKLRDGALGA